MKYRSIEIEGTSFYLDIHRQELVQHADAENRIRISDLQDYGTHYTMLYNLVTKREPMQLDPPEDSKEILIPRMVDIDPEGMAVAYGHDAANIRSKTDMEVITANWQEVLERKQGKLPTISIADDRYIIDIANQEFRYEQDPNIKIAFKELDDDPFELGLECMYDIKNKNTVYVAAREEVPPGVVTVKLPSYYEMDPIGMARLHGKMDETYLRTNPYRPYHSAKTTVEAAGSKLNADVGQSKKGNETMKVKKTKRGHRL